ncbi:MAG: signal transduction histidine kinase, partial [Chitinophagaceae bacterium]|nr:signal transduction histidine kinase [Chitinophagaceae bacterium]
MPHAAPVENSQKLWRALLVSPADTSRISIQLQLANNYLYLPGDTALTLLDNAVALSTSLGHAPGLVKALQIRGTFYETTSLDYSRALSYYRQALTLALQASSNPDVHDLYGNILNLHFYRGEFINAMRIASDGLSLAENTGDVAKRAHYHNIIGFIHLRQKNATGSETHYRLYLDLARLLDDSLVIADALNGVGEALILNKSYMAALSFLEDSRKIYFNLYERDKLNKQDRLPYVLFKIGYCHGMHGNVAEAISYCNQALRFTKTTSSNSYDLAQYYLYSGHLYTKQRQFNSASRLLRTGLGIATKIGHKENIRDAYQYMHELFSLKNEYDSAYCYYTLYDGLKDSIINENTAREIQQLEANYLLAKKDTEIGFLNEQKKLHEEKIKKQQLIQNLSILFASLVVLTTFLLVNRIRLKRKNRLQQELNNRQSEVFSLTAAIQDKERKRIAQDLHDGMGTLLSAARLKLSSLTNTLPEVNDTLVL